MGMVGVVVGRDHHSFTFRWLLTTIPTGRVDECMGVYNYCTRCGDELPEHVQEKYREDHNGGPVLCRSCAVEIFQGIPKAMQAFIESVNDALSEAFKPLVDARDKGE